MPQPSISPAEGRPDPVYEELCKLLPSVTADELVGLGPRLAAWIPELQPMLGFDQHSPHHAYDVFTHTAHVVEAVPKELGLRWAALLHDVGKPAAFTMDENGRITAYPIKELQHLLKDEDPSVKRTECGFVIERTGRDPVIYEGKIDDLKILRDGYIVEVFVNGGEEVYTALL